MKSALIVTSCKKSICRKYKLVGLAFHDAADLMIERYLASETLLLTKVTQFCVKYIGKMVFELRNQAIIKFRKEFVKE